MRAVKNRRSLTPNLGVPAAESGAHAMRRGGPRHVLTERVHLVGPNLKMRDGWALNISRGGVRAILEERVELGEEYEVTVGEENGSPLTRKGRVVWVQEEPDGVIAGFEFVYQSGAQPSADALGVTGEGVPGPDADDPSDDD
jgi:hypothetical protein